MSWFRRSEHQIKQQQIATTKELEKELSVELKANTKALDKAVAKAQKTTNQFNNLIKKNGFTLEIRVAAGGKK